MTETTANKKYLVVVNALGQYSIWDCLKKLPAGWFPVGEAAAKAECLERIEVMWKESSDRFRRSR